MAEQMVRWFLWLFRCGVKGSLLLNMAPGDQIVAMIQYRQYLCVTTRMGELYFIDGERLVEFKEAEIQCGGRMKPEEISRW